MYRVLIVDDDKNIRDGLSVLIDWENYGFKISDTADDGTTALKLMEDKKYDLIITDIRMPELNGLELAKKIKKNDENVKIAILSGYSEFKYAHDAIEIGVSDYIIKPINDLVLINFLIKMKREIDSEKSIEAKIKENERLIRYSAIRHIALKEGTDKRKSEYAALLDIYDIEESFFVFIIENNGQCENYIDIIEDISEKQAGLCFETDEGNTAVVFKQNINKSRRETAAWLSERIIEQTSQRLTIAIGSVQKGYDNICISFENAQKALEQKFFAGHGEIISYDEVKENMQKAKEIPVWSSENLIKNMELLNMNAVKSEIDNLVCEIKKNRWSSSVVTGIIGNIIAGFNSIMNKQGGDINNIAGEEYNFNKVNELKNVESVFTFLNKISKITYDYLLRMKENYISGKSIIEEITKYVQDYYYKKIILKDISQEYYMNALYVGRLFKKHTGKSFNEYVNSVRMDKAIELLLNTDLKIFEICSKVGFSQFHYFNALFKKFYDKTPSEYRKEHI